MGMTLKELLTKGEGTLTAGEAKTLASQCRMDVETLYTLLEERGIKILDDEADGDTSLDVEGIMAEVESAEANSDELGLGDENEDDPAEENPADLKAAMDELLDDPVKNYLKQIGQIPLLSAEQEVDLSKRIHAGAEAAHILQADRQKYGAPEYIKKNSARFSFEEDENSRSYTEDLDEEGNTKSSEDDEEKAAEEEAMEAVENGPLTEERRQELLKIRRDGLNARRSLSEANLRLVVSIAKKYTNRGLQFLDLIQEGNIGLMKAIRHYDPDRGARLMTFAVHWIRSEIQEYIIRNWRIVKLATTKNQRKLFFNLRQMKEDPQTALTNSQAEHIALALDVKPKEVLEMEERLYGQETSLDTPSNADDDSDNAFTPSDWLTRESDEPEAILEEKEHQRLEGEGLQMALRSLDERSRRIITARYLNLDKEGNSKAVTLQELANEFGVSAERIRQIEKLAIQKMRQTLEQAHYSE